MKSEWDYIIVGGGTAGCVLANRLSQGGASRVLLLEAGPRDLSPFIHVPAGRMRMNPRYDWAYPAAPDPTSVFRAEPWESGKVLGGSGSVNGMMWVRGNARDYDGWADAGCDGWAYDDVLPYFKRAESFVGGADKWRGSEGSQHVDFSRIDHPLTDRFIDSAESAGFPRNPDYNGAQQAGVGVGQVLLKRGLRHSTARGYLNPARRRRNLSIKTGVSVRRILFDGARAVGVEFMRGAAVEVARCRGEVILSAGALGSPRLLELSGIGERDRLDSLGIPVVVDSPNVGLNLLNHVYYAMVFEVDTTTLNRQFTLYNVLKGGLQLVTRGKGIATSTMGHALVFGALDGSKVDYQGIFSPFGVRNYKAKQNGAGRGKLGLLDKNAVTVIVGLLDANTRGEVHVQSSDPDVLPLVAYEYYKDPDDLRRHADACRRLREVMNTAPIAKHVIGELEPGSGTLSDEEWANVLRQGATSGKHYAGTCRMGVHEAPVVDPELRVLGAEGLRVIDLSVAPTIPSGNTYAAAVMVGEKGSDLVMDARKA